MTNSMTTPIELTNGQTAPIRFPWDTPPEEGTMLPVAEGVFWIRLPLPMRLNHVNIYVLDDGDGWTIVDTGFFSKRGVAIWDALMDGLLKGKPIRRAVITHHHPDHVGAMGWLAKAHGVEIWATRTAWLFARMLTLDVQETESAEAITFMKRAGMPAHILEQRLAARPFNFADSVHPIPLGFKRISDGDVLTMGGRDWDVRFGHGHAPDHATFWAQDGDIVITGDQIIPGISSNLGVYPTEPDADPVGEWLASCERLLAHANGRQLALPGHKLPFTGVPARLSQLIDNHHGALARLVPFLETPRVAAECFSPLFGREIEAGAYGLALVEAVGHLNHLHRLGQVERKLREDGAYVWQKSENTRD